MDEPLVFSITFFFFLILLRISLVIHGGLGRGRKEEEGELIIYFETCKEYLRFSQFFLFHVISKQLLCHLRRPFCVLWVLVFNYIFFDVLLSQRSKPGSHVFASSLTASNTKRANLTWLPLEIMHRGHTWHDYSWPRWRPRRWFRKFTVRFRPIRKEIVSELNVQ